MQPLVTAIVEAHPHVLDLITAPIDNEVTDSCRVDYNAIVPMPQAMREELDEHVRVSSEAKKWREKNWSVAIPPFHARRNLSGRLSFRVQSFYPFKIFKELAVQVGEDYTIDMVCYSADIRPKVTFHRLRGVQEFTANATPLGREVFESEMLWGDDYRNFVKENVTDSTIAHRLLKRAYFGETPAYHELLDYVEGVAGHGWPGYLIDRAQ